VSESIGYELDKCFFCNRREAGYQRYETYARVGPLRDACQRCAEQPYEQPKQFQEAS
jgi:hypothetical protein